MAAQIQWSGLMRWLPQEAQGSALPLVMILVVLVLLVGANIIIRRNSRKPAKLDTERYAALGFKAIEKPDPQTTAQILSLYQRGRGTIELKNVFHRSEREGDLYIYDVRGGSDEDTDVATRAVGLVRRGANLPHFKIYPIPEGDGLAGKLAMQWISKAQSQGEIVRFDDQPEFTRRFTVLSTARDGEEAVRRYLSAELRQKISTFPFFILLAGGDVLAIEDDKLGTANPEQSRDLLGKLADEALQLGRVIEPAGMPAGY